MHYLKQTTCILCLIALLCGCAAEPAPPEVSADTVIQQYTQAAKELEAADCICMNLTIDHTISYGEDTYTQSQNKSVILQKAGEFTAHTNGTIQYGQHQISTEEIYKDGQLYLSLNSNLLCAALSQEAFLADLPPIKMIDPSLYGSITTEHTDGAITLHLEEPIQAEAWALPDGAAMLSAKATAEINQQGDLYYTRYSLTFQRNDILESYTFHVQCYPLDAYSFPSPDIHAYQPVDSIQAPIALEKAYGMLLQATHLTGTLSQSIYSQASSIHYYSISTVKRQGDKAQIETTVSLEDPSRGGKASTVTQLETFENGSYTITKDQDAPQKQSMDSNQFFSYCTELLSQNILSSSYVTQCTMENLKGSILLTFHADNALAQKLCENTCATIYQDPGFLDSRASDYQNHSVVYRITVDAITGLPLACDMDYSTSHTIEQLEYSLETHYRQTYSYQP